MSSRDVEGVRFTQTQLRRGYDEEEVDTLLADLARTLEHLESGGAAAEPGASAESSAVSSASPPGPPGQRRYEFEGGILHEEESWGTRLLRKLRGDRA